MKRITDELVNELNASIGFDERLYREDIEGSLAHALDAAGVGILSREDAERIAEGLAGIREDLEAGRLSFSPDTEDIHMSGETELTKRIGEAGKRLHTARSRNDQVALDFRLYLKRQALKLRAQLLAFVAALLRLSKEAPA